MTPASPSQDELLSSLKFMFIGLAVLMVGLGLQGAVIGVEAQQLGYSTGLIGVMMFTYFTGLLIGSRWVGSVVTRSGAGPAFASMASVASTTVLIHGLIQNPWMWIALRLMSGFCIGAVTVIAESWLAATGTTEIRGRITAWYFVVTTGGYALGSFLAVFDSAGMGLYVLSSIFLSISIVPILLSGRAAPEVRHHVGLPALALFRRLPLGTVSAAVGGFTWATVASFGAVYALGAGADRGQAATFASALVLGALLIHMPVGYLADRVDRRRLLVAVPLIGIAAALCGLVLPIEPGIGLYLLGLFIGAATAPMYSLGISYSVDQLHPDEVYAGSVTLVTFSGIGMLLGPALTSVSMALIGPSGFFVIIAAVSVPPLLLATQRLASRTYPTPDDRSQSSTVPHRPSLVFTEVSVEQDSDIDFDDEFFGDLSSH